MPLLNRQLASILDKEKAYMNMTWLLKTDMSMARVRKKHSLRNTNSDLKQLCIANIA
jgi:hypothetical protein